MHVTGACHCGAITFSAEVDESKVMVCHCTSCQVLGASAFRYGAIVLRESFVIRGQAKEYRKVGTSGSVRTQVFCPECATGIYSYTPGDASPYISLRLGAVHQRAELKTEPAALAAIGAAVDRRTSRRSRLRPAGSDRRHGSPPAGDLKPGVPDTTDQAVPTW